MLNATSLHIKETIYEAVLKSISTGTLL